MSKLDDFLGKAADKRPDSKETIRRVHRRDGVSFATDGFRVHAVKQENAVPDLTPIFEKMEGVPFVETELKLQFILDAIADHYIDGTIVIRIYATTDPTPAELYFSDGSYAAIMPYTRTAPGSEPPRWRPFQNNRPKDETES